MSLPTDPQGALENISLNLGGDLERLPLHILLYKLQMVKAICDGALRKVEQNQLVESTGSTAKLKSDAELFDWWGNQPYFWTVRKSAKGKWTGHELWGAGPNSTARTYGSFNTFREAITAAMRVVAGQEEKQNAD